MRREKRRVDLGRYTDRLKEALLIRVHTLSGHKIGGKRFPRQHTTSVLFFAIFLSVTETPDLERMYRNTLVHTALSCWACEITALLHTYAYPLGWCDTPNNLFATVADILTMAGRLWYASQLRLLIRKYIVLAYVLCI